MDKVIEIIRAIRNIRALNNIAPSKKINLLLILAEDSQSSFESMEIYMRKLANIEEISYIQEGDPRLENTAGAVCTAAQVYVPLTGLIDVEKEVAKLNRDADKLSALIARCNGKLNNQGFLSKAPSTVVLKEKAMLKENEDKMDIINKRIEELKAL